MKFDFDKLIDRRNSGSVKWDESAEGVLPLWVADMDFEVAPCIMRAIEQRVRHGVFGYTFVGPDYYEAIVKWFKTRHNWVIKPESVIYTSGVVPALSAIIRGMAKEGDGIIIQSPVYNCFYSSIRNNGCRLVDAPLIYHPEGYTIDFEEFENLAACEWVKFFILCNPHNPVGRVWTKEELTRLSEICIKHNVFVISDEIHCELTYNGHDYTPYQSLGEKYAINSVACVSPSKAFNIAGLQIANIICPDKEIYARVNRGINENEVCDVNPFGVEALKAAYNDGWEWLTALKSYLWENYIFVKKFFETNLPEFPIQPLQGTYLVWINCKVLGMTSDKLSEDLIDKAKIWLSPGTMYGEGGQHFLRLNIACPRVRLEEGLRRLKKYVEKFS